MDPVLLSGLFLAAVQGDTGSLDRLMELLQTPLTSYFRRELDFDADIEDAVQETSRRVTLAARRVPKQKPYSFPGGAGFPAFVRRIANGVAIGIRMTNQGVPEPHDPADGVLDRLGPEPAGTEGVEELRECLGHLDESDRELLRLIYAERCTVAAVVRELGVPRGRLVGRLCRARRRLLAQMTARYPDLTALLFAEGRSRD